MGFRGLRRSSLSPAAGEKVTEWRVTRAPGAFWGKGSCSVVATLALVGCFWLGATSAAAAPGDLDPSFSSNGKLVAYEDFALREPGFSEVVIQGDGKIVAAGDYGLVRFNPDGTTDDSFDR